MRDRVPFQPLGRKRSRIPPLKAGLVLLLVIGVGIGAYFVVYELLAPPTYPEVTKHVRFKRYSFEVIIDGAPSNPKKTLSVVELIAADLHLPKSARGYGIAVPAIYRGFDGKDYPLTYRPGEHSSINSESVPTTYAPTPFPEFGLISVRNENESMKEGLNSFEIHYSVDQLPLAAPNGAESFSWSFPSPARDFFVSDLQVAIVLPRYAETSQVRASAALWRYKVKQDGSIDLKRKSKVGEEIPYKTEDVFLKGTAYRQISLQARELSPYESLDVKIDW